MGDVELIDVYCVVIGVLYDVVIFIYIYMFCKGVLFGCYDVYCVMIIVFYVLLYWGCCFIYFFL